MNSLTQNLMLAQMDRKMSFFRELQSLETPKEGWIFSIRSALKMSLRQLGVRLHITPQSVKELEEREKTGSITLRVLRQVAHALDSKLIYVILPNQVTLESMIESRARELAEEIVLRTSHSMKLENQEVSKERLQAAIEEKAKKIRNEMPSYLWD
ncbi:MAG: mobile mystery protein A [Leptospiraceae bacterium]|nr:mobile mystery protein A [Leptospiraceae bacterium]